MGLLLDDRVHRNYDKYDISIFPRVSVFEETLREFNWFSLCPTVFLSIQGRWMGNTCLLQQGLFSPSISWQGIRTWTLQPSEIVLANARTFVMASSSVYPNALPWLFASDGCWCRLYTCIVKSSCSRLRHKFSDRMKEIKENIHLSGTILGLFPA